MTLLVNTLSGFVIAFLPRSKCLLISWLQSLSSVILEPKKIKSVTVSTVPHLFAVKYEVDAVIFVFLMLSFKPAFSLSFTFIKRSFNSSSLSVIRVVSSAYLRLLIFLPVISLPACASSSPAFHMMYSAYKLIKQGDNIQPWCSPFPILNQSIVPVHLLSGHMYVDHLYAALCLKTVRLCEAETIFQSNHISVTHVHMNRTRSSWANLTSSGDIV